jgi:hypothetical protein
MPRRIELAFAAIALALTPPAAPAAEGPPETMALVERMVAAHGGMEAWRSAPTVAWVEVWESPGGGADAPTRVVVEQTIITSSTSTRRPNASTPPSTSSPTAPSCRRASRTRHRTS